jgi:hypothetical protein
MAENTSVCALRHADGSIKWFIDEETAIERGADPSHLVTVEIPQDLWQTGSIQEIGEYVASLLEAKES